MGDRLGLVFDSFSDAVRCDRVLDEVPVSVVLKKKLPVAALSAKFLSQRLAVGYRGRRHYGPLSLSLSLSLSLCRSASPPPPSSPQRNQNYEIFYLYSPEQVRL